MDGTCNCRRNIRNYKILVEKPKRKTSLDLPRSRRKDNIKTALKCVRMCAGFMWLKTESIGWLSWTGKGPSGLFPPKMRGIFCHCLLLKRDSVQWNWHSLGIRSLSCLQDLHRVGCRWRSAIVSYRLNNFLVVCAFLCNQCGCIFPRAKWPSKLTNSDVYFTSQLPSHTAEG